MKFLTFSILFFTFSFSSFSQDTQKKWSIEASLTPTFSFSKYTAGNDSPYFTFFADLYQENEIRRSHTMLGGSIQASYWITNSLRVNSGINYTAYGAQYHTTEYDDAPTVLQVYTQRIINTNHYLGIPLSFSAHFLKKEKSSLYATLGCNFDFLIFKSQTFKTKLVYHMTGGVSKGRNTYYTNREDLLSQGSLNGFSPSLSASFGVDLNINSKSQLRIGPHAQFMIRPYQVVPVKHYFYNIGLDITYVFANW